jgi:hypothetical protein
MNNEMAGNIMSLVNGLEDILEAVAKELNATSTARHPTGSENNMGIARQEAPTWNATPKCCVHCLYPISSKFNRGGRAGGQKLTEKIPIFLSILSSSSLRTNNTRRRNACSQAYNLILDTGQVRSIPRDVVLIGRRNIQYLRIFANNSLIKRERLSLHFICFT